MAERRLAGLERLVRNEFGDRTDAEAVSFEELVAHAAHPTGVGHVDYIRHYG